MPSIANPLIKQTRVEEALQYPLEGAAIQTSRTEAWPRTDIRGRDTPLPPTNTI